MSRSLIIRLFLLTIFVVTFVPLVSISYSMLKTDDQNVHSGTVAYVGTGLICAVALAGMIVMEIVSRRKS